MRREIKIEIPADEDGMVGRQCPTCERVYRVSKPMYQERHYLNLRCPYCRLISEFDECLTEQQREYAEAMMYDEGRKMVKEALDEALGDVGDVDGSFSSGQSISSPHLDVDMDECTCSECGFEYAVLPGEDGTVCPVCR